MVLATLFPVCGLGTYREQSNQHFPLNEYNSCHLISCRENQNTIQVVYKYIVSIIVSNQWYSVKDEWLFQLTLVTTISCILPLMIKIFVLLYIH